MITIDESVDENSKDYFYVYQIESDGTKTRRGQVAGWFYAINLAEFIQDQGLEILITQSVLEKNQV